MSTASKKRRRRKTIQKWRHRKSKNSQSIQKALFGETAKAFFDLQKLKYERCLEPAMTCDEKPIRAHSIQNSHVLDRLQANGHVIMPRVKLWRDKAPTVEFEKVGRNEASTFTGLCSKHDTELFKTIDNDPFDPNNEEHKRLLAYRSVMHELHTQLESALRIQAVHDDLVRRGKAPADKPSPSGLATIQAFEKAWRVYRYRARHFDAEKPSELEDEIIELADQPAVIAVSCLFSVDFTKEGDIIGPTLNVIPLDENRTIVIISYPKKQREQVRKALNAVLSAPKEKQKLELSKLIVHRVENFALSPTHYEAWSQEKQKLITGEYQRSAMSSSLDATGQKDLMLF